MAATVKHFQTEAKRLRWKEVNAEAVMTQEIADDLLHVRELH